MTAPTYTAAAEQIATYLAALTDAGIPDDLAAVIVADHARTINPNPDPRTLGEARRAAAIAGR